MALDAEYFDSIYIDVVKKKYYNANKVRAVFEDIRRQAEALNAENALLRQQLSGLTDRKVELGDAILSAQAIYQEIVERAKVRADQIILEARQRSEAIQAENQRQQDYAVHRVEEAFNRIRQQQLDSIDTVNAEWQKFLCGLYPDAVPEPAAPEADDSPRQAEGPGVTDLPAVDQAALSRDLEEKIGAIADRLFSMDLDEHDGDRA